MASKGRSVSRTTQGAPGGGDLGQSIAMTGGFAFAVASFLAIRDAWAAETGLSTVLPFVGASIFVAVGLTMQRLEKQRPSGSRRP